MGGITREKGIIALFFALSTAFLIYQHTTGISWDFSVYVLNAQYIFSGGNYIEWYRSPLPSILIFILSPFGYLTAEYLYISMVSMLHLYACLKFAERFKLNRAIFYVLSLSVFILFRGMLVGSELLSLSLLMLFLTHIDNRKSGMFLGLAFLARYSNIIFLPLLFMKDWRKDWKKIVTSLVLFLLVLSPWLVYNQVQTGSPFTSVFNSYALNVYFRKDYMFEPPNPIDFLVAINFLTPLLLLGILKNMTLKKEDILMFLVLLLSAFSYMNLPHKEARYLIALVIPAVYFSMIWLKDSKYRNVIVFVIVALNVFSVALFLPHAYLEKDASYRKVVERMDDCGAKSNAWVPLTYLGKLTGPAPRQEMLNASIEKGYRIVLFKAAREPEYVKDGEFLRRFPIIHEGEYYYIIGDTDKCLEVETIDKTYTQRLNETVFRSTGESIETDPVKFLLSKV